MSRTEAILSLSFFVAAVTLHADVVLPTTGFNGGGACNGSASQLSALNGIEGVGLQVSCSGTGSTLFQVDVSGPLTGGTLTAGTPIPFTFSFQATEQNAAFPVNPFTDSPGAFAFSTAGTGQISSFQEVTQFDGYCGPFTNTCFVIREYGNGTITFPSDLASGTLTEFGFDLATMASGSPTINVTAAVDFNATPIPEPSNGVFVLAGVGLLCAAGMKRRARV